MKEPDLELEGWRQQWNAHETVPPDLANAVEAGTRSLRRGIIAEIVVTIVMGGGALGWAIVSRRSRNVMCSAHGMPINQVHDGV